jgi:amidase
MMPLYVLRLRLRAVLAGACCLLVLGADMTARAETFRLEEATIADAQRALRAGAISSVELTTLYLNRILAYDRNGIRLNALVVMNPQVLEEAAAADRDRANGVDRPLLGIPFTVKDSYKVKGLTVAAGSPAFATLIADEDAFVVARLRAAGGVLIGKTNMPPLADGGMQRGLYGRAESPYNAEYLTAAWGSGSSNGSGTATAANFAMFGMGEETVSSGRSPSSNNALVAYTPSRGLISIRGNWPLYPLRDVIVPMTRSVPDLLALLNVLMVEDPITRGDLWRDQRIVDLPKPGAIRPERFETLASPAALKGKRIGVPTLYLGAGDAGGTPIQVRASIAALWNKAGHDLESLGAEVVPVDFPLMRAYEKVPGADNPIVTSGLIPAEWWADYSNWESYNNCLEFKYLNPYSWEQFLADNHDPNYPSWRVVDPAKVFPNPPGTVEDRRHIPSDNWEQAKRIIEAGVQPYDSLPRFRDALAGIERTRKVEFEEWLRAQHLDLLAFPANADVGLANSDVDDKAYDLAQRNGVVYSNTNWMLRHLGIPSVSVPMGLMADIGMPVNLMFIGPAYGDTQLLSAAYAYEQATHNRRAPPRTPALAGEVIEYDPARVVAPAARMDKTPPSIGVAEVRRSSDPRSAWSLKGTVEDADGVARVRVYVNGHQIHDGPSASWQAHVAARELEAWGPLGSGQAAVTVLAADRSGNTSARVQMVDLR